MIFLGVALMVPAAAFLVWRVVQGFGPLMRGGLPPPKTIAANREMRMHRKIIRTVIRAPERCHGHSCLPGRRWLLGDGENCHSFSRRNALFMQAAA